MNKSLLTVIALLTTPIGGAAIADSSAANPIHGAVADARRSDADRERDKTRKPVAVLDFFGVEPGMQVLDLLSGGGYYTEILSHAVGPSGEVVAHVNDIYEEYNREEIAGFSATTTIPPA